MDVALLSTVQLYSQMNTAARVWRISDNETQAGRQSFNTQISNKPTTVYPEQYEAHVVLLEGEVCVCVCA